MQRLCIAGLAVVLLSSGWAYGNFVAYNDCWWESGQFISPNVTTFSGDSNKTGSDGGMLKDFATGADTGVTADFSWDRVSWDNRGTDCAAGTDAQLVFGGAVSLIGMGAYESSSVPASAQVVFTGLDPAREYEFVTTANRAGGYLDRYGKFMISGAEAFTNESSAGVIISDGGASSTFVVGENTTLGYVARWTGIRSGQDGSFTVWSGNPDAAVLPSGGLTERPYMIQAFRLTEVPEPTTLGLLALGGLALLRRR